MPPPEYTAEALKGIQGSALAIFDQRRQLNDAFDKLREAAAIFGAELQDDGTVSYKGVAIPGVIQSTPKEVVPLPPPEPEPEPEPETPTTTAPSSPKPQTLKDRIFAEIPPGTRKTAQAIAQAIGEEERRVYNNLKVYEPKGQVLRDEHQRWFLPAPVTKVAPVGSRAASAVPKHGDTKPADDGRGILTWNAKALGGKGRWTYTIPEEYNVSVAAREEDVLALFSLLKSRPNADFTAAEAEKGLNNTIERAKVSRLMGIGVERGFFYLADRRRSSTSPPGTRFSDAFRWVPDSVFTTVSKLSPWDQYPFHGEYKQPPAPSAGVKASPKVSFDKEYIRTVAVQLGEFTILDLVKALGIENPTGEQMKVHGRALQPYLTEWTTKGMFTARNSPSGTTWKYVKPHEPGKAAEADAARGRGLGRNDVIRGSSGGQVSTESNSELAKALRGASKDVRDVITQVRNRGAEVKPTGDKHFMIRGGGAQVLIGSKQNTRGMLKQIAELRRANLITA